MIHENSLKHAIVYGPTGSGKSSQIFYNNYLINRNASLIIRNVAGDFLKTAAYLKSVGYKIVNINLKNAALSTDAVNFLRGELSKADISRISKQIVSAVYQKQDYWGMSAEEYCSVFVGLIKEQDESYHNLYNLKYIVESYIADETSLDYLVAKSKNEDLVNSFMAMSATPEKTRLSSLSTLKSCFARIDENIALATSSSTFDWQQLRREKTIVFIESSVLDDSYLNMIQSLLYTDILKSLMDHGLPKSDDLPVYMYLDECSSLSIGTILQTAFLNARKYQISITAAFQDPTVLRSAYSKEIAQTLEANAFAKIYLKGMEQETADFLERFMGKREVVIDKEKKMTKTESVMTAFEIRTMKNKSVLLTGNNPACILKMRPHYKIWRMRKRLAMPMPKLESLIDKIGISSGNDLPRVQLQMPHQMQEQLHKQNNQN